MRAALAIPIILLSAALTGLPKSVTLEAKLEAPVSEYQVPGADLINALNEIATRFQLPMGIEWVRNEPTLRKRTLSWKNTTVKGVIRGVLKEYPGYAFDVRDGVVHVFKKGVRRSPHNFLNLKLRKFSAHDEEGGYAGVRLRAEVQYIVSPPPPAPGPHGSGGSYIGPVGERHITLSLHDITVRDVLDKLASVSQMNVWVVTFAGTKGLTPTGFYRTATLWHPAPFPDNSQPMWDLFAWGQWPRRHPR